MISSSARMQTEHAREYLTTLANVTRLNASEDVDDSHALIQLPNGYCVLTAGEEFLDVSVYANSKSEVVMLEDIISDCLDAVARNDELHYQWIMAPASQRSTRAFDASAFRFAAARLL